MQFRARMSATVTVLDDDANPPVIGIETVSNPATVPEGMAVVFGVIDLRGANGTPLDETIIVRVDVSEDEDFLIEDGIHEVTIMAGQTQALLELETHNDIFMEANSSTVTATVLTGEGYRLAGEGQSTFRMATATVQNDTDTQAPGSLPILSVAPVSSDSVTEGDTADFMISAEGTLPPSLTVIINVDDGDHNFVASGQSNPLTIAQADFPYTHEVMLDDDNNHEFTGEVTLTLLVDDPSTPTYAIAAKPNNSASVTVTDDDAYPIITMEAVTTGTPDEGADIMFRFNASSASTLVYDDPETEVDPDTKLRVNIAYGGEVNNFVESGTSLPNYVEFDSGSVSTTLTISTDDDLLNEDDGGITVTVVPGMYYQVGDRTNISALVGILDNDDSILTIAAGPDITEGEIADFEIDLIPAPAEKMMVYVAVTQYGNFIDEMEDVKSHAVEIGTNGSGRLMVQTIADEQDEFDGRVIATLQNDSMSPARYTVASAGGMMKDFGRELNGSVYVEVADDDAPVTQITIATNRTLPIVEGNSFTFTLSADPTPESYAPIVVELAVEEENSIGYFTEFTSAHKVSDNTFRITDRNNPIVITAHTEDDGVDEDNGRIYISIVDKADYIGSEQDAGRSYPTNTIDVEVHDVNNDVPVVSITAADSMIDSVVEGNPFAFTVTMLPAPPAGTLQHIELEVTEEVEANDFYDRLNLIPLYVGDSGMVTAEVLTNDDSDYQYDSDITVTVMGINSSDGVAIYRAHHTDNSVTFTVNNNDDPVISVSDFNVLEGTGDSEYNLELNLGTASAEDVTIEYVVADGQGTATIDDDYELVGSEPEKTLSVMIESGEQSAQIPLLIKGDTEDDPVETFVLTLTATNAEFENGTNTINVTGSIVEMPVVSISTTQTITSDADYIEYTVSASPVTSDLSVLLDVIDAVENIVPEDNEEITVSLTAEASSFSDELEFDKTTNMAKDSVVAIEIRENANYIIDENNSKIEVTVVNSEELPVVSIEGVSPIIEGNNAVFNITVTDQRDINDDLIVRTADIAVNIMVIEGSTNFITGTPEMEVTIAPTENSATIVVETTLDDEAELDDETGFIGTITAVVQAGTGYQAGGSDSGVGRVNILDSVDFPIITFNTENNTAKEGGVIAFPFVVTGAATDDTYEEIEISFEVNTNTSTADEGANRDFTIFQDSPITLEVGETTGRITIRTNRDPLYEAGDETFDIVVTATNAVFSESTSSVTLTGTIEDINENPPVISVSSVSTPEDIGVRTGADTSDDEITFAVTLSEPSEVDVTFYVETVDLSAISRLDYTPIENTCYTGVIEPECFSYESRPRGGKFTIPAGEIGVVVNEAGDTLGGVDLEGNAITGLTIPIMNDTRKEANERFLVRFTNARHATFAGGNSITVIGTILDDETRTISFANVNYEVHEMYDSDDTTTNIPAQPDYITDDGSGNYSYSITLTVETSVPAVEAIALTYDIGQGDGDSAIVAQDPDNPADGEDFGVATPADLSIASGESSATITIPIVTNVVDEPDQTFTARITGIDSQSGGQPNAILRRGQPAETTVTIRDTLGSAANLPILSFDEGPVDTVQEMDVTHMIEVGLDKAAVEDITFDITVSAGTAVIGEDFIVNDPDPTKTTPTRGMIVAGSDSFTIPVVIKQDTNNEGNQTFDVTLSNIRKAVFTGTPAELTQTITIEDDEEPTMSLAKTEISVAEDVNGGEIELIFELTGLYTDSTGNADLDITYSIETTGTEATEGVDFDTGFAVGASGTATIAAGELSETITIDITDDALFEGNETFKVKVADEPGDSTNGFVVFEKDGVTVTELVADITIIDDEVPTLMVDSYSNVGEDDGQITIGFTLSGPRATDVVFEYNTEIDSNNDSRADQADFVGQFSKSATISANSTTTSISIGIIDDDNRENNEEFKLVLSNLVDAKFVDNTATTQDLGITIEDDEAIPTLSVTGVTSNAISIDEDDGPLVLELVLTGSSSDEVISFDYATADGTGQNVTAVAGEDYTAQSSTKMVMEGASGRIEIPILSDTKFEEDENFTVTLSNLQNATFTTGFSGAITVTITNDDPEPTMTIENEATELSFVEGIGNATFDVVLSNPTYKTVTVNVATGISGVTDPTEADDFTDPAGTLTFAPSASGTPGSTGSDSETITIALNDDSIYEEDEAFVVTVSGVANATFGRDQSNAVINELPVTVTIEDDEDRSVLTAPASRTVAEGVAGGNLTFDVTLTPATDENTVVDFETITGSAIAADFTGTSSGTVTINATETTAEISIPITDDDIKEIDEEFTIKITLDSTSGNAYINSTPQEIFVDVTITDNDDAATLPVVKLSANATAPTEEDSVNNGSNFAVQIEIDEESANTVSIDYAIAGVTATLGEDFIANSSGTVFITTDKTVKIPIPIIDDESFEGDETFTVTLSNPQNATLSTIPADRTRMFTIGDSDTEPALSIRGAPTTLATVEGESVDIGLVLSSPAKQDVVVSYTLANGTASDSDYVGSTTSGSITIPAGTTFKTLSIGTTQDTAEPTYEDDETFTVTFTAATNVSNTPSGGVLSGTSAIVVTIIDEEAVSMLTADTSVSVTEGNPGGATNATINLTLTPDSTTDTVVLYSIIDGTAKASNDFTVPAPANRRVTISAGDASGSFDIAVNTDMVDEDNEVFYVDVTIDDPGNTRARINGNAIRIPVTIMDDDNAPVISLSNSQTTPITEGTNFSATLALTGHSAKPISVDYTITGSATPGVDFVGGTTGTAIFDLDPTFITIPTIDDDIYDADETMIITLSNPGNATLSTTPANRTKTFTITDNDEIPEVLTPFVTIDEGIGTASISMILDQPVATEFKIRVSGSSDDDFSVVQTDLTFAPGVVEQTFNVNIVDDLIHEARELKSFAVEFLTPSSTPDFVSFSGAIPGNLVHSSTVAVRIEDNDPCASFDGSGFSLCC